MGIASRAAGIAGAAALAAGTFVAGPAQAAGPADEAFHTLFDGTAESLADWSYAGDGGFLLQPDGTLRSKAGAEGGGFGTLWYTPEQFDDFTLKLEFRDDAPGEGARGNSGVQVRFPAPIAPLEGCPTTFNGGETGNASWIAVNCGHEIQINDSPDVAPNDPRKTGSVYGFADLDGEASNPVPKGVWSTLEIRVVDQHYTVLRDGVVINDYENLPGVPFPGRPNDPDSSSRGLTGYVGLQAHGSPNDAVSFRNVTLRELDEDEAPAGLLADAGSLLTSLAEGGSVTGYDAAAVRNRLAQAVRAADRGDWRRAARYVERYQDKVERKVDDDTARDLLSGQADIVLEAIAAARA